MLTNFEIDRYQRHFNIREWDETAQERLKKTTVFVAGAGGLGSPVLYYLAAAGVGKIIFCDRDKVDLSNLNRQILYDIDDLGKDKVFAAAGKLGKLNDCIELLPLKCDINDNITSSISGCDLIIDCVDNFEARHTLNRISLEKKIPLLHAGVTEFYAQLTLLIPGKTPCLGCIIPEGSPPSGKGIVGAMAGIAGSVEALEAIKFLTGIGENLSNRLLFIDMKNISFNVINIKKNPECRICSGKGVTDV